ncbi:peptide deformylase [Candidatus Uhrbacteria bacterium]|nr:peptide deformylase [Candidatus Uhrbacteria bacterium]
MSALTVLHNPNPELRVVSQPVTDAQLSDAKTQALIDNLIETMAEENGVGIAAPQVGAHQRIIIVETPHGVEAFINPEITSRSVRMVTSIEGCLSVPGISGAVKRHSSVKVKAKNRKGEELALKANGLLAIIFQHEIDHLDGILFIDRATNIINHVKSRL